MKKPSPSITLVPIDPLRRSGEPGVAHSPSTDEDPKRVPEAAVTPACNADSSDSSDSKNGTTHWCDEDVFSNGGARCGQDSGALEDVMPQEESNLHLTSSVAGSRHGN